MSDVTPDLYRAVTAAARLLHGLPGDPHRVTSPLGVWLLLATVAHAASGEDTAHGLDEYLGMPRHEALALADALAASPHPVVLSAVAAWFREDRLSERVRAFVAALPGEVASGPLPTQAEADEWVRSRTLGLIGTYPVRLDDPTLLVTLANALACTVGWRVPFRVTGADRLGPGPFRSSMARALQASPGPGHDAWVADSPVGRVAVHVARAEGLDVLSVVADADVPAADVVAAAHELASAPPVRVPLRDLPLGDTPAWTVGEVVDVATPREVRDGRIVDVTLPAWSARSQLDLTADPGLGFAAAGDVLARLVDQPELAVDAKQSAVARYHRVGFEAAAVTAIAGRMAAVIEQHEVSVRVGHLRFPHPYAVVAVARPVAPRAHEPDPWDGIPVFSAWVVDPEEPTD